MLVTFQIMDGADRGRKFHKLPTPITIGREEGNTIQLNDERVSRFHLKIQEDQEKIVLTDLESTNGTKVNGEETQLQILRHGDLVSVGRSVLLFGSEAEIAERLASERGSAKAAATVSPDSSGSASNVSLSAELAYSDDPDPSHTVHALEAPELPARLSPAQAAQLSELLTYLHVRMRHLLSTVKPAGGERISLEQRQWQNLVDLQNRLAGYLRRVSEPSDD